MTSGREEGQGVVELGGSPISIGDLSRVVKGEAAIGLAPGARDRMEASRKVLLAAMDRQDSIYGTTTGVAERKRVTIDQGWQARFNRVLIEGHRCAQGPPASPDITRATMLCLANGLSRAMSGVRPEVVEVIINALRENFVPSVSILGSLGEADIGPLADLAHGLLEWSGLELEAGEALALMNSNSFATGWAALALRRAERFLDTADATAALELEAFGANLGAWHRVAVTCRPLDGIRRTIENVRNQLSGSFLWEEGRARNLQDPMSFRCLPQTHGAAREALSYVRRIIETEINAVQTNPVVLVDEDRVISVGNFEATGLSAAIDFARLALAPVISSASERTVKLLQEPTSGLPAGLSEEPGLGEDALAELAVGSQSLAVEARVLAHPVSFELASSFIAEGIEDRATMAPLSARRLDEMVGFGSRVLAIGLVVAAQAVELRGWGPLGRGTAETYELVRSHFPLIRAGEGLSRPLEPLVEAVASDDLWPAERVPLETLV